MEGADIGKASSRTHNGKRSSWISSKKEETGKFFAGVLLLLRVGVEIVEDGLAVADFVNHVVDCAHDDAGVHMGVIRKERTNIIQRLIIVRGVIVSW